MNDQSEKNEEHETAFYFHIGEKVQLRLSGEAGEVIGVAFYARRPPANYVEYLAADGRQCEGWFDFEALLPA